MRKPKYDPKGFVSRLESLAKQAALYAVHQKECFEVSMNNSAKRLTEAYQKQNEYIEYLENKLNNNPTYHLYEVTNGYQGYVPVSVEVMARNEKEAFGAASVAFRHHSQNRAQALGEKFGYSSDYWLDLKVSLVAENAGTSEWIGEVKH